jgi:hypothetical protein
MLIALHQLRCNNAPTLVASVHFLNHVLQGCTSLTKLIDVCKCKYARQEVLEALASRHYTTAANEHFQLGFETNAKRFLLNLQGTLG